MRGVMTDANSGLAISKNLGKAKIPEKTQVIG